MPYLHSIKLERQSFAFSKIIDIRDNHHSLASLYKSMVESLGMMIYNNGLVSVLSRLKNSNAENKFIYEHIAQWLDYKRVIAFSFNLPDDDLLECVLAIDDSRVLLALTIEILVLTDVMKEILKAEID